MPEQGGEERKGRGQTCPDGHRGPGGQGRGVLSEVSVKRPLLVKHPGPPPSPHNQQEPPPHVSFLSPSPAHVVVISVSLWLPNLPSPNENVSFP